VDVNREVAGVTAEAVRATPGRGSAAGRGRVPAGRGPEQGPGADGPRAGSGAAAPGYRCPVDNRDAIGSWLSGPRAAAEQMGADFGYRGQRLGLPADGPGSIAPIGRRVAAVFIDWLLCVVVAYGLLAGRDAHQATNWALAVFAVVTWVGLALVGSTPGKTLLRLRVIGMDGRRLRPLPALIRTVLLALFVPAVVWDRDTRGLHDKAARSVEIRV
jgi:hypothetical protein